MATILLAPQVLDVLALRSETAHVIETGQKAPGFSRGMNGSLHSPRPSAILPSSLAAHQHRFGAVPRVQASISSRGKPAEWARKEWHWGDNAWVAKP